MSICLLTIWYHRRSSPAKTVIDSLINRSLDLSKGIRITTTTALVLEVICRIATCSVWTHHINNVSVILWAIWMPQIHLFVTGVFQILFISFYITCNNYSRERRCNCDAKSEFRTFTNMCATVFGLFYMLFPTIILMFAYPTQIFVIFTFVTAYLFATSIFSASIVKIYHILTKSTTLKRKHVLCHFVLVYIILWFIVMYLHMLVIFVSYSLLIGKGSVINTGPLFLISLLPSALLSGGAWIVKKFAFNDSSDGDGMERSEAESNDDTFEMSRK